MSHLLFTAGDDRKSWDIGRFVRTVAFFNKPPSPGEVLSTIVSQPAKIISALTGGSTEVWSTARRRQVLQLMLWSGTIWPTLQPARAQEQKSVILPLFGDSAMSARPSSSNSNGSAGSGPQGGIVLVSGATGGVGRRVVQVRAYMYCKSLWWRCRFEDMVRWACDQTELTGL
jgi:hypothetical protein